MHYSVIRDCDIANGEGVRVSLFVSGCRNKCPGCFNEEAWDFNFGQEFTANTMIHIGQLVSKSFVTGLTILGGEPLEPENSISVMTLVYYVKFIAPSKTIWLYTGFKYDDIINNTCRAMETEKSRNTVNSIIRNIDILVDGRFIEQEKDIGLKFRGSRNQRIIDMNKTIKEGHIILWDKLEGK